MYPIYQMEEQHRNTYLQLVIAAQRYGITPEKRQGMRRNPDSTVGTLNTERFLADPDAYARATWLAELKGTISSWRLSMSSEASEMRELLEEITRE
jgi:hypothetical protein